MGAMSLLGKLAVCSRTASAEAAGWPCNFCKFWLDLSPAKRGLVIDDFNLYRQGPKPPIVGLS